NPNGLRHSRRKIVNRRLVTGLAPCVKRRAAGGCGRSARYTARRLSDVLQAGRARPPGRDALSMNSPRLSSEQLREFTSFRTLAEEDLLVLAGSVEVKSARRGEVLFRCGDIDARD